MTNYEHLANALRDYRLAYNEERERVRKVVKSISATFRDVLGLPVDSERVRTVDVDGPISTEDTPKNGLEPATGESVYKVSLWLAVLHPSALAAELRYEMEIKVLKGAYAVTVAPGYDPIEVYDGYEDSFREVGMAMYRAAGSRLLARPGTRFDAAGPIAYYTHLA